MSRVVVIGGGAAGMMAAIAASEKGHFVCLLEKNEKLGKKLFITGKGRCNVTNAADTDALFSHVCTNSKFLYSAFYRYDNHAVMDWFEKAGCPLKTERGDRVFPVSDHSSDIIATLQRQLKKQDVEVLLNSPVEELLVKELQAKEAGTDEERRSAASGVKTNGILSTVCGVRVHGRGEIPADAVIICTGGVSYPSTGSTGDGYRFAIETGHRTVTPEPSLVPLETSQDWCKDLMGLSLRNVGLRMVQGKRELFSDFGEMLFTHFGISGPMVLSASCHLNEERLRKSHTGEEIRIYIDLKPALDEEQLDRRLLRDFEEAKNKQFKNALGGLFPARLIPVMVRLSGIAPEKKVNEITRGERMEFVRLIKNLPLVVTGHRGFDEAIITRGGVNVKDVNPSTMESKLVKGLYFAGEVLDLDAYTGGFNLQIAWSTGHLAGSSVE